MRVLALAAAAWLGASAGAAQTTTAAQAPPAASLPTASTPEPVGSKVVEIYRIAPGQHEAFLRAIALYDEVNRQAGIPPRQLYVHSEGANWDFMLIQDARYPEGKGALVDKAWDELSLPSGPRFFTEFRKYILEHTDTSVSGPTTAAAYLKRLDATPRVTADGRPMNDAGTYEWTKTVSLGGAPRWDCLRVDPAARRLYVAHDTALDVLGLDTRAVVGHVTGLARARGIALAPEIARGFVSSGDRNAVVAFSLDTLTPVGEIPVGKGPGSVTFEPVTRRVFAWNASSGDATVLDARSLKVVKTVALGGTPGSAVADGKGALFVGIENTHEVVRVDASQAVVTGRFPLAGCSSPTAIAIDAAGRRLFSACANGVLAVANADTGRSLGEAPIGSGAEAIVFDPASSRLFVSNGEGFVSVFDASGGAARPLGTIQTRVTGRTMALDPATGALFVPAVEMTIDWETGTAKFAADGLKLYVFDRRAP